VLADATGSATKLLTEDRIVLRKMRHADAEARTPVRPAVKHRGPVGARAGAH
jgi:hypothetical protein